MLTPELVQKVKRIEITARHLVADLFAGEYESVFRGRGMEFDEVRPYHPGDDLRRIDWNVTARMAETYVRHYQEERELTVMLLVDASGSAEFGTVGRFKREMAAELAAVISLAATNSNDRVGLMVFTDGIELLVPPSKGRRHVLRMVRDLLAFQASSAGTDIGLALSTVNLLLKRKSIVFLISDLIAPINSYRRALSASARRHDVIAVELHDPAERDLPRVGIVALEDAESGDLVWVDTDDDEWRRSYRQDVELEDQRRLQFLNSVRVDVIPVSTDKDYVRPLNEFFKLRSKRRIR